MQEKTKWSFRSASSLQGWKGKLSVETVYDTVELLLKPQRMAVRQSNSTGKAFFGYWLYQHLCLSH